VADLGQRRTVLLPECGAKLRRQPRDDRGQPDTLHGTNVYVFGEESSPGRARRGLGQVDPEGMTERFPIEQAAFDGAIAGIEH
jgi:hypothetical protein